MARLAYFVLAAFVMQYARQNTTDLRRFKAWKETVMPRTDQPHVLLICTDHWPGSLLGAAGHATIQTPTLDELAHSGVRFTNAYSECPVCIPARRTLMTGTTTRTHGCRQNQGALRMPQRPTIAQTFRDASYQAYAVGKLHVFPQRDRIGFDDVILGEEGRLQYGVVDDYELFLDDLGCARQQFAHGMCNNEYVNRPWHLPEACHVTNWTTQQMARLIKRRDPTRPGFWYLSYCHPHPPLAPLACYLDMYREIDPGQPYIGEWASDWATLPYSPKARDGRLVPQTAYQIQSARRAFYALCTHIDRQLRVIIGTLREEGLLDNTIIPFTSDHGDMLSNHSLWAKSLFYEDSANVPMILVGIASDDNVGHHRVDNRLVGWQDVMPTLLELAGVEIPHTVEGTSMVGEPREWLHGECGNGESTTKMIHDGRFKLIYYPTGNCAQLFDLQEDPHELNNFSMSPSHTKIRDRLTGILIGELCGEDEKWVQDGKLVELPDATYEPTPDRGLSGQRGLHWPVPIRINLRRLL